MGRPGAGQGPKHPPPPGSLSNGLSGTSISVRVGVGWARGQVSVWIAGGFSIAGHGSCAHCFALPLQRCGEVWQSIGFGCGFRQVRAQHQGLLQGEWASLTLWWSGAP